MLRSGTKGKGLERERTLFLTRENMLITSKTPERDRPNTKSALRAILDGGDVQEKNLKSNALAEIKKHGTTSTLGKPDPLEDVLEDKMRKASKARMVREYVEATMNYYLSVQEDGGGPPKKREC